jgi:hypothetical protein
MAKGPTPAPRFPPVFSRGDNCPHCATYWQPGICAQTQLTLKIVDPVVPWPAAAGSVSIRLQPHIRCGSASLLGPFSCTNVYLPNEESFVGCGVFLTIAWRISTYAENRSDRDLISCYVAELHQLGGGKTRMQHAMICSPRECATVPKSGGVIYHDSNSHFGPG